MPSPRGPVGVFDSGVGGLTVVSEIRRRLPDEEILYFGDTARVPYGNKSRETVIRYSREIARFLVSKGVRVLVVACNTSSSMALGVLEAESPVPVLGMIGPGSRAAVACSASRRVGLIGTRATVSSGAYTRAIHALDPDVQVFSHACPLLVPLVEEGWAGDPVAKEVAARYLEPLLRKDIDTLILGCTHYPVLIPVLAEIAGPSVRLLSSARTAVDGLLEVLDRTPPAAAGSRGGVTFFVTDAGTHFKETGTLILGEPIGELVPVDEERLVIP